MITSNGILRGRLRFFFFFVNVVFVFSQVQYNKSNTESLKYHQIDEPVNPIYSTRTTKTTCDPRATSQNFKTNLPFISWHHFVIPLIDNILRISTNARLKQQRQRSRPIPGLLLYHYYLLLIYFIILHFIYTSDKFKNTTVAKLLFVAKYPYTLTKKTAVHHSVQYFSFNYPQQISLSKP